MKTPYDDIINLPHPTSTRHPQMAIPDRAAQFSPFAALTGHDAAIRETARLTERRIELDEDSKTALDLKLRMVAEWKGDHPKVSVTYFEADQAKAGGSYETTTGCIKKIDDYGRRVIMENGRKIDIDNIIEIESELFGSH
ncbi:MAG: hypothetical protein ACRDBO_10090 [Lachnospiraceae bacterium]